MSFWILLQVILNIFFLAGVAAIWFRLHRPGKDDPRLSRGLQLLQSKISVLEDLSDRTETQVKQLTALMEAKVKEIQQQILISDRQIQKIESSRDKSLEVAKIFQDRIPHQEIIERQNTIKYVKAARLAHQGLTADEIAKQVDLSQGELEFITKVNRNNLQFSEEALPEWAKEEPTANIAPESIVEATAVSQEEAVTQDAATKEQERMTLAELGEKFRLAMQGSAPVAQQQQPQYETASNSRGQQVQVKKVVFPRVGE